MTYNINATLGFLFSSLVNVQRVNDVRILPLPPPVSTPHTPTSLTPARPAPPHFSADVGTA